MLKHMVAAKVYKNIQEMRRGCSNILRCLFQIGFLTKDVRGDITVGDTYRYLQKAFWTLKRLPKVHNRKTMNFIKIDQNLLKSPNFENVC